MVIGFLGSLGLGVSGGDTWEGVGFLVGGGFEQSWKGKMRVELEGGFDWGLNWISAFFDRVAKMILLVFRIDAI